MSTYYAVGAISTDDPDGLAEQLTRQGCDDLGTGREGELVVSFGPFFSTAKNLRELEADARHYLARLAPYGTKPPTILNASPTGDLSVVYELAAR